MADEIKISVFYPLQTGKIVLRTSLNWNVNVEPTTISADKTRFDFQFNLNLPYFYFKPCIVSPNGFHWSKGTNYLALMNAPEGRKDLYPYFFDNPGGSISEIFETNSNVMGETRRFRVYFPPGYRENILKRYPVLYMHDGSNLFLSDEAFFNREWRIDETMDLLDSMNLIDKVIVVGVYPRDRMREYTKDRYEFYGRFLVEELKPQIDSLLRTLPQRERTATMGASLGGVVSLYLGWQFPQVFGKIACLSSTFGYNDDLAERIIVEPKRDFQIYLDSAWKTDNYEVNRSIRNLLVRRGYKFGEDLLYFSFPEAEHNENYWALRSHIPFQFLFGKTPDIPAAG